MEFFGLYLKALRENKYTQRELAKRIGVSFPYISKLENGIEKFPSDHLLYKIAEVFNLHPAEVFLQAGRLPAELNQWLISRPHVFKELLFKSHQESDVTNNAQIVLDENYFMHFFEASTRIMLLIDPESGNIIEVSPKAEAYYGVDRLAFRHLNIRDINPLSQNELMSCMEKAKNRDKNVFKMNHMVKGELRTVIVNSEPIILYGKTLLHTIIIDSQTVA